MDWGSSRGVVSPTAGGKSHVSRVEALGRTESITGREPDFATGYSLGLIGGVRAWVCFLRMRSSHPAPLT